MGLGLGLHGINSMLSGGGNTVEMFASYQQSF